MKTIKKRLEEMERELAKERGTNLYLENRLSETTAKLDELEQTVIMNGRRTDKLGNSLFSSNITGLMVVLDVALLTVFGVFAYIKAK